MRNSFILGFLFYLTCIISPGSGVLAEGSKEIYIGAHNVRLFSCNDIVGKCNNGGDRTQFMSYDGPEADRLYFIKLNSTETVYMGFSAVLEPLSGTSHVVFRIKDLSGTIVYPETSLPSLLPELDQTRSILPGAMMQSIFTRLLPELFILNLPGWTIPMVR